MTRTPPFRNGDRLRLIAMVDDPAPIPPGTEGTVNGDPTFFADSWDTPMRWDNGRTLSMVVPPDQAEKIRCRHRDDGRGRCIDCGAFID
ncbi:DUF4314 domain-containing protein [Bradyrhizobium diazoefficiens]|jgi:hypothetical protein